jgi:hypothetical protein
MARRRELFRLAEVEIELATIVGKAPGPIMLTDLQEGTLKAVVQYPSFRDGLTEISASIWRDVDLDEFAPPPRRRSQDGEFVLSADEFISHERAKLKATTVAVFRRSEVGMDTDYLDYLRTKGSLKDEMAADDWEKLILACFRWQRDLAESARHSLVPMVKASALERYLYQVKSDYRVREAAPSVMTGGSGKGGRHPVGHWNAIVSEAFRRLAKGTVVLADGNVQDFANELRTWGTSNLGENVGVPTANTIAGRLRNVLKGGQFEFRLID